MKKTKTMNEFDSAFSALNTAIRERREELLREAICRFMGGQCVLTAEEISKRGKRVCYTYTSRVDYTWDGVVILTEEQRDFKIVWTMYYPKEA